MEEIYKEETKRTPTLSSRLLLREWAKDLNTRSSIEKRSYQVKRGAGCLCTVCVLCVCVCVCVCVCMCVCVCVCVHVCVCVCVCVWYVV